MFHDGFEHHNNHPPRRMARNGTLILGGGFGGAHVARLLGKDGATIVNQGTSMLYTPLLPEVAAGASNHGTRSSRCGTCARTRSW